MEKYHPDNPQSKPVSGQKYTNQIPLYSFGLLRYQAFRTAGYETGYTRIKELQGIHGLILPWAWEWLFPVPQPFPQVGFQIGF